MAYNIAFYSQIMDALPEPQMRLLGEGAAITIGATEEGGRQFIYQWPDLTIRCTEMPPQRVPSHLDGFAGYVRRILGEQLDERGDQILDRIRYTRLVVGVVVEPDQGNEGRDDNLLGALAYGLNALLFQGNALYDKDVKLILAPDGSFDPEADVLGPVAELAKDRTQVQIPPSEEGYIPTATQRARYDRTQAELNRRRVPTLSYPLYVEDDSEVTLREPAEVARRALVLAAVVRLADGGARDQSIASLDRLQLWPYVSPEEQQFLRSEPTDPDMARKLLWRLEGLWVLGWALGDLELPWPKGFCDVPRLMAQVAAYEGNPDFITQAKLRPRSEILDAVQLTMLHHWAIRDAWIHHRPVPADLDWTSSTEMLPVAESPVTGIVAERHHVLNWLICFGDADWDDVDTPT